MRFELEALMNLKFTRQHPTMPVMFLQGTLQVSETGNSRWGWNRQEMRADAVSLSCYQLRDILAGTFSLEWSAERHEPQRGALRRN